MMTMAKLVTIVISYKSKDSYTGISLQCDRILSFQKFTQNSIVPSICGLRYRSAPFACESIIPYFGTLTIITS